MISISQFTAYYGIIPYYLITNGYNNYVQTPIHLILEDVKIDPKETSYALRCKNIYDASRDILKCTKRAIINTWFSVTTPKVS